MKPARGPQTMVFSNYCSGIPGLANYEMPHEAYEGNFWGTFFRHRASRSARNGCHGLGLGTWRPAILEYRLFAAGLKYLSLGTSADHQQSWNAGYWQLGLGT